MRAIRFRCWDKDNSEWLVEHDVYSQVENQARWNPEVGERFILMQFTGLRDKNGVEVFEGDKVQTGYKIRHKKSGEIREDYRVDVVTFGYREGTDYKSDSFYGWLLGVYPLDTPTGYKNPHWDCLEEKFEVVGNIYEGLLK